jgi:hypothetical protein
MSLREWIDKHPKPVSVAVAVVIAGSMFVVFRELNPGRGFKTPEKGYFTTDDGATYFPDSLAKLPPFDHDGKEAVRAFVVSSDGGAHQWVAYLGKYAPKEREAIESGDSKADRRNMLVKAPGSQEWIPLSSPDFVKIIAPAPPGMGTGPAQPVWP